MGNNLGNNYGKFYSMLSKPVLADCSFVVDATNGLGITSLKGQGVKNVFMHTSATPTSNNGYLNPNPAVGYALVELAYNYTKYYGGSMNIISPLTGSDIAINGSALTVGQPYVITSVGHGTLGAATIAPVADVSGSLASSWFSLYDNYGNTFIIWFSVSGVGARPNLGLAAADGAVGLHYVQQSILSGATAAQIGAALVITINALPSGVAGVFSFTSAGTTTVTVTSTQTNPYSPLPGVPSDGTVATGFTFAITVTKNNLKNWQDVGVPKGVVPAVGVTFVATATGDSSGGGSSGLVKIDGISGITSMELVGNANVSIAPIPMNGSANSGGWILIKFLGATNSSTTTLIPTAPAAGTGVDLQFYLEQSTEVGGNNE